MDLDIKNTKMLKAKKLSLDIEECQWKLANGTLKVMHRDIDAIIPLNEVDKIAFIADELNPLRKRQITIHHFEASKPAFIFTSEVAGFRRECSPVQTTRMQILFDDIAVWSRVNGSKIEWIRYTDEVDAAREKMRRFYLLLFYAVLISSFIYLVVERNPLSFVFIFIFGFIWIAYKSMYSAPKIYRISKEFISRKIE